MPSNYDVLPDLAFGRHPVHGIVAANPKNLAASTWVLKGFDFHPVADHPTLYALAHQDRDGEGRTTRAVKLLRKAGYRIDVDATLDPPPAPRAASVRERSALSEPDVAIAEHPQLGIVAATSDYSSALGGRLILEEHGWRLNPDLDIYTLPITVDRSEALERVANATVSMHRSDLQVAVQPRLAQDVAARRPAAPAAVARRDHHQGVTTDMLPTAVALATSPARRGLAGDVPASAPAPSPSATWPVDPRIAFSRNR